MREIPITAPQRAIAYLLLVSQLFASCGWNETILPVSSRVDQPNYRTVNSSDSDTEECTAVTEAQDTSLVLTPTDEFLKITTEPSVSLSGNTEKERNYPKYNKGDQAVFPRSMKSATEAPLSHGPYTLRKGHQVRFIQEQEQWIAQVKESLPQGFSRQPLLLPMYLQSGLSMQAVSDDAYIDVVFPHNSKNGKGYVVCARKAGLLGGVKEGMRLNVEDLINLMKLGYAFTGRQPSNQVVDDWRSFLDDLAGVFANVEIDFSALGRGPISSHALDPGNMKSRFEDISSRTTERDVRLENYGEAYINLIDRVRAQITQKQSLSIDPAQYPGNSYDVYLKPSMNILGMFPTLQQQIQTIYSASVHSRVSFDLEPWLLAVDVEVRFNSSFSDFEREEQEKREREEQERVQAQSAARSSWQREEIREVEAVEAVERARVSPAAITEAAEEVLAEILVKDENAPIKESAKCNIGVYKVFERLTGNNELKDKLANQMVDYWRRSSHWEARRLGEVQGLANKGYFTVAGWQSLTESGHVSVIVPGREVWSEEWKCNVPMTMDTGYGHRWASKALSYGFGKGKKSEVEFYRYSGSINKK